MFRSVGNSFKLYNVSVDLGKALRVNILCVTRADRMGVPLRSYQDDDVDLDGEQGRAKDQRTHHTQDEKRHLLYGRDENNNKTHMEKVAWLLKFTRSIVFKVSFFRILTS